jgi:hypothetical protein
MDDRTVQATPQTESPGADCAAGAAGNVPASPRQASAWSGADGEADGGSDHRRDAGFEVTAGPDNSLLDADLDKLLRDLDNPELLCLRNLFNMC